MVLNQVRLFSASKGKKNPNPNFLNHQFIIIEYKNIIVHQPEDKITMV